MAIKICLGTMNLYDIFEDWISSFSVNKDELRDPTMPLQELVDAPRPMHINSHHENMGSAQLNILEVFLLAQLKSPNNQVPPQQPNSVNNS